MGRNVPRRNQMQTVYKCSHLRVEIGNACQNIVKTVMVMTKPVISMIMDEASITIDGASLVMDDASMILGGTSLVVDDTSMTIGGASMVNDGAAMVMAEAFLVVEIPAFIKS